MPKNTSLKAYYDAYQQLPDDAKPILLHPLESGWFQIIFPPIAGVSETLAMEKLVVAIRNKRESSGDQWLVSVSNKVKPPAIMVTRKDISSLEDLKALQQDFFQYLFSSHKIAINKTTYEISGDGKTISVDGPHSEIGYINRAVLSQKFIKKGPKSFLLTEGEVSKKMLPFSRRNSLGRAEIFAEAPAQLLIILNPQQGRQLADLQQLVVARLEKCGVKEEAIAARSSPISQRSMLMASTSDPFASAPVSVARMLGSQPGALFAVERAIASSAPPATELESPYDWCVRSFVSRGKRKRDDERLNKRQALLAVLPGLIEEGKVAQQALSELLAQATTAEAVTSATDSSEAMTDATNHTTNFSLS